MRDRPGTRKRQRIVIIGSGFSGLCMAIRLKQRGVEDFVVLERGREVGGTWRDNTYPGCACDVPSHLYSFSFAQKSDWSRTYASQREIEAYLKQCAADFDINRHIRFGADVIEMRFDEPAGEWIITTADGGTTRAAIVVNGTGPLNKPIIPNIPGQAEFEGVQFHSGNWDHTVDLADKRVAVIGTGASAIQIVPNIAEQVADLTLFQRTPAWVVPRFDRAFSGVERWLYKRVGWLRRLYRGAIYWYQEQLGLGFLTNIGAHKAQQALALSYLKRSIPDPALRGALTPDYRIGCKRILISDDFYAALNRPDVQLVTDPVERFTSTGIVAEDGLERPFDAVIYATGFAATEFVTPMRVYGRDGVELSELWRSRAESYLGITVAGFPNFFMLIGPNTGLGHNSMVFMIECQVRYVLGALDALEERHAAAVEMEPERQRAFCARLQDRMRKTTWMSGCRSWYLSADGSNYTLWPGFTVEYWWRTRRFDAGAYRFTPGADVGFNAAADEPPQLSFVDAGRA